MSHDRFNSLKSFSMCMVPFLLDNLRDNAHSQCNLPWYGIATSLCYARNAIYLVFFITFCTSFMEESIITNLLHALIVLLTLFAAVIFHKNLHYIRS